MNLSTRAKRNFESDIFLRSMLAECQKLKEKYGKENILDFASGDPCEDPPEQAIKALIEVSREKKHLIHAYMQNGGFPWAREKVAHDLEDEYHLPFRKEHVIMTWGAAGSMNVILKAILNTDDEVILIAPFHKDYVNWVENHGGRVVISMAKGDFSLNINDIESKISASTKAIIINSPCNPSGKLFSREQMKDLGELLQAKSRKLNGAIYLLSDETYRRILFDGIQHIPPVEFYENTIIAGSYSMSLAMPGERTGYIAVHPYCAFGTEIIEFAIFLNRTLGYINCPAVMQRVIVKIDKYLSVDSSIYQRKRDMLFDALLSMGLDAVRPQGTFFMFPRSPVNDDMKWIDALRRERIFVLPGTEFCFPGFFRIAFCVPDEMIEKAISGFEKALKNL
jgi:aspartate aminotransferase